MKITSNKIVVGLLVALVTSGISSNASELNEVRADYYKDALIYLAVPEQKKPTKKEILDKYKNKKTLTDKQLVKLLKAVGFKGEKLKEAYGIAKRESNGRPLAYNGNRNTGDHSYGIFQINMIGELGPDRREKFKLNGNDELFDPVTNTQIAFYMSRGGENWSSWYGVTPRAKEYMKEFPNY